jgi:hypothetical protein
VAGRKSGTHVGIFLGDTDIPGKMKVGECVLVNDISGVIFNDQPELFPAFIFEFQMEYQVVF